MRTDPAAKRRRRLTVLAIVSALLLWGVVEIARRLAFIGSSVPELPTSQEAPRAAPDVRVPPNTRIRVEVLNATSRSGLARRATFHLRDAGFDVVRTGTWRERGDTTVVIDRTGHPEWAALLAKAVGGARVESRPDSSGYVDLTLLLGAAYRPPAQPFYP